MPETLPDGRYQQPKRIQVLIVAALSLTYGACGYFKAGKWEDDRRNWSRAFGGDVPNGWSVIHSRYWRSPHFTYEAGYYFAVKVSASSERQKLMKQPDLTRYEADQLTHMNVPCGERPNWFAPKQPTSYDAWGSDGGTGNYRLLIDKETADIFFSDCQF